MFNVYNGDSFSLDDIHHFQEKGSSVIRSVPFGNLNKSTIFIGQEGFQLLLDENLHGLGHHNYKPAYLYLSGKYYKIYKNTQIISSHVNTIKENKIPTPIKAIAKSAKTPGHFHWLVLQKLKFKNANPLAKYIRDHAQITNSFLDILSQSFLNAFHQYVDNEGYVYTHLQNDEQRKQQIYVNDTKGEISIENTKLVHLANEYWLDCIYGISGENLEFRPGIILGGVPLTLLICLIEANKIKFKNKVSSVNLFVFTGGKLMDYLLVDTKIAPDNQVWLQQMFSQFIDYYPALAPTKINLFLISTSAMGKLLTTKLSVAKKCDEVIQDLSKAANLPVDNHELSQYDLIAKHKKLYFPDHARAVSQATLNDLLKAA